jgi:cap1 methyltransferase
LELTFLSKTQRSKIDDNEPLYFVDICAGPGGFSEYVLWRKKNKSKGFGMTLRGDNDFRLDDFIAGAPEYFETYYGLNGVEGDGDITNPGNLTEFAKFVLSSTNDQGVHFVMADGVRIFNQRLKNKIIIYVF